MKFRQRRSMIILREEQQAALIEVLQTMRDPDAVDLVDRLLCCRESREGLRKTWSTRPDFRDVITGRRYRCERHACWSCRRRRVRETASKEATRFANADSLRCSLVTIADTRVGDLDLVRPRVSTLARALRDRRDAAARECPGWGSVEAVGHVELDPYAPEDVLLLAPEQREVIEHLPILKHSKNGPLWTVRAHLAVKHEGIDQHDLLAGLRRKWNGVGQVHAVGFDDDQLALESAGAILSYSAKHLHRTRLGMVTEDWPVAWQASYWLWLHKLRRGLQPLRVSIGPQRPVRPVAAPRPVVIEPLPFAFSNFSVSDFYPH